MECRWIKASALGLGFAIALSVGTAHAQSPDELKAARELFQEAYKDESEQRYADALEKFQRVAKVKESASVRYRIATVLAAMGRLREARDGYRALAAARGEQKTDQEVADSAAEKAAELDKRIPKLVVRLDEHTPQGARVSIDAAPVSAGAAVELDPGEHLVAGSAPGANPYEQKVTLPEGAGEVTHTVTFEMEKEKSAAPPLPAKKESQRSNTWGWVAVGGGTAVALTGVALLLAREGAIDDIEAACPNDVCPTRTQQDVFSARHRAELFGPLGVSIAAVGAVVVGVGVYLLVRPKTESAARLLAPRIVF
jgi:hypothetical protein